jgi:hypothetical protein
MVARLQLHYERGVCLEERLQQRFCASLAKLFVLKQMGQTKSE